MSKKDKLQNKIDVCKSALNTLLITFFGLLGFIFVRLNNSSFLEFLILVLSAFILIIAWFLIMLFFIKYNNQIENE